MSCCLLILSSSVCGCRCTSPYMMFWLIHPCRLLTHAHVTRGWQQWRCPILVFQLVLWMGSQKLFQHWSRSVSASQLLRIHLSSRSDRTTGLCVLSRPVQCRTERLLWGQSGVLHNSRCLCLRWAHSPSHSLCGLFLTVWLNMDQLAFRHTALFNPHNLTRSSDGVLHTCCEEQCALRRNRLVKTVAHRAGTRSEQAAPWCWFLS